MRESTVIRVLRRRRSLLLKAWLLHVGCFMSTCAFAATDTVHVTMATALWLVLVTIPPVLFYTVLVDRSCRNIEPTAPTAGLAKVVVITLLLTPLESSLVLPVKNLLVSRRILAKWGSDSTDHPGHSPPDEQGGQCPPCSLPTAG